MKHRLPRVLRDASAFGGRLAALCLVASLAVAFTACDHAGTGGATGTASLEPVEPPQDLPQLDQAVQEQFHRLHDHLLDLQKHRQHRPTARAGRNGTGGDESPGSAWGALGEWYDVYGYGESARSCFRNAVALSPDEPRWPYFLGMLSEDDGDLDEAEARYQRAADLAPDVAAPKVRLGDVALRRQDLERAEHLYDEVLSEDPDNPGALLGTARLALARDEPDAALAPLQELSRTQPEAAQVNYTLSLVWRRLGDDQRADEALNRVPKENLDQIPLDIESSWDRELRRVDVGARTLTRRGVRAFHRGDKRRAAVLLGQAVTADPKGAEKRINYALALREIGLWRAAYDELNEALARADEGSELKAKAHLELGRLLVDTGRPGAAMRQLEATLKIDPRSAQAHLILGRLEQRRGKLEAALGHYTTVRDLDGEMPGVRFWHAALLLALDRQHEAFDALAEDIRLADDPSGPKLLLARLLATTDDPSLRDIPRARKLLDDVANEETPDVLYAETAAMVSAARGDFDKAIAWQSAAVDGVASLPARGAAHTARRRLVLYREHTPCTTPWEGRERDVTLPVKAPGVAS